MKPRLSFALFAVLSIAACGMIGACSNQSEGEPCNVNSDDCSNNLQCIQTPSNNGYRCCPVPPATPTTVICALNNSNVVGNNPTPTEGGTADAEAGAASPDAAGTEASPADEGAPESSTEAAIDSGSPDSTDGASE
jgi:hypothetical protein